MPCNEEWFFTPRNTDVKIPWHVLLKWRLNNPAGFEGNTGIYINTIDPWNLRDKIAASLLKRRDEGKIAKIKIGNEVKTAKNSLEYWIKK